MKAAEVRDAIHSKKMAEVIRDCQASGLTINE